MAARIMIAEGRSVPSSADAKAVISTASLLKIRLLWKNVFFGTLLANTPLVESDSVPIAATDMRRIYINPQTFGTYKEPVQLGILAHECLHIACMHGLRRQWRDARRANYAADYAADLLLDAAGFDVREFGFVDSQYKGLSFEEIYERLPLPKQGGGGNDDSGSGGESSGGGSDNTVAWAGQNQLANDLMDAAGASDSDKRALEGEIRARIAAAAQAARQVGQLSAGLERVIEGQLNPQAPWTELLREYLTRLVHDDASWNRRNRRIADWFFPSADSYALGEIIWIGDTSGSIRDQELTQLAAEANAFVEECRPERFRMVWADDPDSEKLICAEQIFESGEPIVMKPIGGGGTDMRKPLQYCEQFEPPVVVLVTDGYTPWPDSAPPFPLIVCCTTNQPVPQWAQVVRIRCGDA